MRYGRLILDTTKENDIDIIQKIKDNERLDEDYTLIIKSISIDVIDYGENYSVSDDGYQVPTINFITDNTNSKYTTQFEINHDMPLNCMNCELTEASIVGTTAKVKVDYGY